MTHISSTTDKVIVTLNHDTSRLNALQDEWITLQRNSNNDNLYMTWDWITIWWEHFGNQGKLWLLEARTPTGTLVGLAPLMCVKHVLVKGVSWRQLEFIGTSSPFDHLDFIVQRGFETAVIQSFLQTLTSKMAKWDVLCLSSLPSSSPHLELLRSTDIPWQEDIAYICPLTLLPSDWDTFYMSLSHNKRKQQRRALRDFDAAYPDSWTWNRVENPAEIEDSLNNMIRLHQSKWVKLGLEGGFADPVVVSFHHTVARRLLDKGYLGLYRLQIDGRTVATEYTYFYRGRVYTFASGVDSELADLSPGHILTEKIMQDAVRAGLSAYDFLRGEEDYKARWNTQNQTDLVLQWLATPQARLKNRAVEFARVQWAKVKRYWHQQSMS